MNRYLLHIPRIPINWVTPIRGQIWGWREQPKNTGFYLKLHGVVPSMSPNNVWIAGPPTDNSDRNLVNITEEELKRNYVMVHE